MFETIVILMCSCGSPEVIYLQDQKEMSISAYGPLGISGDLDKMFKSLCRGDDSRARENVQVWHLDKLNGRQCPIVVKHQ